MEEFVYYNNLYDYYRELLTDKQRCYFEDYYQNNLTLSEIADNYQVSRNAIHKQLKETTKLLEDYEAKLGLYDKMNKIFNLFKDDEEILSEIERIIG